MDQFVFVVELLDSYLKAKQTNHLIWSLVRIKNVSKVNRTDFSFSKAHKHHQSAVVKPDLRIEKLKKSLKQDQEDMKGKTEYESMMKLFIDDDIFEDIVLERLGTIEDKLSKIRLDWNGQKREKELSENSSQKIPNLKFRRSQKRNNNVQQVFNNQRLLQEKYSQKNTYPIKPSQLQIKGFQKIFYHQGNLTEPHRHSQPISFSSRTKYRQEQVGWNRSMRHPTERKTKNHINRSFKWTQPH